MKKVTSKSCLKLPQWLLVNLLWVLIVCVSLTSCNLENSYVRNFRKTTAYELAKAVAKDDTLEIEKIVASNKSLMEVTNPNTGFNSLRLALLFENYQAFSKLLKLGANPKFINQSTKRSVLIDACRYYWKEEIFGVDLRFIFLLLEYGADPNYVLKDDYEFEKGLYYHAASPIDEACRVDLRMVKLLLKYGADPFVKIGQYGQLPFETSYETDNYEISTYFIDSLKVNPLDFAKNGPYSITSIQNYVMTEYNYAKMNGDFAEMKRLEKKSYHSKTYHENHWKFMQKLESMGVDFKNFEYSHSWYKKKKER